MTAGNDVRDTVADSAYIAAIKAIKRDAGQHLDQSRTEGCAPGHNILSILNAYKSDSSMAFSTHQRHCLGRRLSRCTTNIPEVKVKLWLFLYMFFSLSLGLLLLLELPFLIDVFLCFWSLGFMYFRYSVILDFFTILSRHGDELLVYTKVDYQSFVQV